MKNRQRQPSDQLNNGKFTPFSRYHFNGYSQNGEQGVIHELLERIGWSNLENQVVEFGAWDGKRFSNTFSLVETRSFKAIYIESDKKRFEELLATSKAFTSIIPINVEVSRNSEDPYSLDKIITSNNFSKDFDILSIDIDSWDLEIWETVTMFEPKIVVIEINSGIMPGILSRHNDVYDGNSFSSTLAVAHNKGYSLIEHTGNLIFLRDDLLPIIDFPRRFLAYPELLFRYEKKWFPEKYSLAREVARRILPLRFKFFFKRFYDVLKAEMLK